MGEVHFANTLALLWLRMSPFLCWTKFSCSFHSFSPFQGSKFSSSFSRLRFNPYSFFFFFFWGWRLLLKQWMISESLYPTKLFSHNHDIAVSTLIESLFLPSSQYKKYHAIIFKNRSGGLFLSFSPDFDVLLSSAANSYVYILRFLIHQCKHLISFPVSCCCLQSESSFWAEGLVRSAATAELQLAS